MLRSTCRSKRQEGSSTPAFADRFRDQAARARHGRRRADARPDRPNPAGTGPRDECGVFGVYAPEHDVARLAYFALYALQHRGQESAGIATCESGHITTQRDLGLVSQVFDERSLRALTGEMAIGHVRYSTTGRSGWENSQPVYRRRPPPGRARPQRQPDQRRRALQRAARAGRQVPLDVRLRDHRRADRVPPGRRASRTPSPT